MDTEEPPNPTRTLAPSSEVSVPASGVGDPEASALSAGRHGTHLSIEYQMGRPLLRFVRPDDRLSDTARTERKSLLGTSVISVWIGITHSVPTKISALGIDLTVSDQAFLVRTFQLVVLYFLVMFCSHVSTDIWLARAEKIKEAASDEDVILATDFKVHPHRMAEFIWHVRGFFDIWLPIVLGLAAIASLSFALTPVVLPSRPISLPLLGLPHIVPPAPVVP